MRTPLITFALIAAVPLWAAGSADNTPPTPTETTTVCEEGQVWDAETEACTTPNEARLDQDGLYETARELAYAGRLDDARTVLALMQVSDRSLTYQGFVARKTGDWTRAEAYYNAALMRNPDNLLARSYYGQGLAHRGNLAQAKHQLSEIRARGGRQTWPELALRMALDNPETGY